jgi:hypothetical protein
MQTLLHVCLFCNCAVPHRHHLIGHEAHHRQVVADKDVA